MTFWIYRDKRKEFRWSLHSRNGKKVGDSAEGYKRKSQLTKMIAKIIMGPHEIREAEDHSHNRR